jgi:hypothetical protein
MADHDIGPEAFPVESAADMGNLESRSGAGLEVLAQGVGVLARPVRRLVPDDAMISGVRQVCRCVRNTIRCSPEAASHRRRCLYWPG